MKARTRGQKDRRLLTLLVQNVAEGTTSDELSCKVKTTIKKAVQQYHVSVLLSVEIHAPHNFVNPRPPTPSPSSPSLAPSRKESVANGQIIINKVSNK